MKKSVLPAVVLVLSQFACALPSINAGPSSESPQGIATPDFQSNATVAAPDLPSGGSGDVIFHNGVLLTMDASQSTAEAILVRGDRIQAVGSSAEILAQGQADTTIIDLGGRTLMPGFVDAHSHMFGEDLTFGRDFEADQQTAIQYGVTTMTDMGMDEPLLAKAKAFA